MDIYKYITLLLKNMYINKLDDIVDGYNNTYSRSIKMKPDDIKSSTNISFVVGNNEKGPKLKVSDCVGISKYISLGNTLHSNLL